MIRIKNQLLVYDIDKKEKKISKFETFSKRFTRFKKIFKYFIRVLSV